MSKPNALVNTEQVATNAQGLLTAFTAKKLVPKEITLRYEDLGTLATGPQFHLREITATVKGEEV